MLNALVLALALAGADSYDQALKDSTATGAPMIVVIGNMDNCHFCRTLDARIERFRSQGKFKGVNYVKLHERDPRAAKMRVAGGIPQIHVFKLVDGEWAKGQVIGDQGDQVLQSILDKAREEPKSK
jgi:hypothetical protein